ncbi:MAG: hypothetical protein P4L56_27560 [Candidatus Sulfopaludibacter sp.]|nr:hypothetical protein [Candidatus Sulfopaludibacter sp.]
MLELRSVSKFYSGIPAVKYVSIIARDIFSGLDVNSALVLRDLIGQLAIEQDTAAITRGLVQLMEA